MIGPLGTGAPRLAYPERNAHNICALNGQGVTPVEGRDKAFRYWRKAWSLLGYGR